MHLFSIVLRLGYLYMPFMAAILISEGAILASLVFGLMIPLAVYFNNMFHKTNELQIIRTYSRVFLFAIVWVAFFTGGVSSSALFALFPLAVLNQNAPSEIREPHFFKIAILLFLFFFAYDEYFSGISELRGNDHSFYFVSIAGSLLLTISLLRANREHYLHEKHRFQDEIRKLKTEHTGQEKATSRAEKLSKAG